MIVYVYAHTPSAKFPKTDELGNNWGTYINKKTPKVLLLLTFSVFISDPDRITTLIS